MVVAVASKPSSPSVGAFGVQRPACRAPIRRSRMSLPSALHALKELLLRVLVVESGTVVPESYYICF